MEKYLAITHVRKAWRARGIALPRRFLVQPDTYLPEGTAFEECTLS